MALDNTADTMYFLPWRFVDGDAVLPPSQTSDLIPPSKNWDRGFFSINGLRAPYYIARAQKERAVVIGCSGLNTHTILTPAEVKKLNDSGISIAWMALPRIPHGSPMMDTYIPLAREFFTNKNSPARVLMHNDVPRYALTHSTGGQIFFHLMHEPDTNRRLSSIFSGAVHVSPYLDTAHASRNHAHPLVQAVFKRYMDHHPDVSPNERFIGRSYVEFNSFMEAMKEDVFGEAAKKELLKQAAQRKLREQIEQEEPLKNKPEDQRKSIFQSLKKTYSNASTTIRNILSSPESSEDNWLASTCGQILELQDSGQMLTRRENFNVEACKKIPSIFVIGDNDNFSCPKTSVDVAKMIGAEIEIAKGGLHDPLRSHPHLLDVFIGKVHECAAKHEAKRAQTVYVSSLRHEFEPETLPYGLIDRLSDRARLALQRGTSSLYSFASLL